MRSRTLLLSLLAVGIVSASVAFGRQSGPRRSWTGQAPVREVSVPADWGEIVSANKDGMDWGVVFRSPDGDLRLVNLLQNKPGYQHIHIVRGPERNR